jgi:hypothetical protein
MFRIGPCARVSYPVVLEMILCPLLAALSRAATWPQLPKRLLVTIGPGSYVDFGTLLLGVRLSKRWR